MAAKRKFTEKDLARFAAEVRRLCAVLGLEKRWTVSCSWSSEDAIATCSYEHAARRATFGLSDGGLDADEIGLLTLEQLAVHEVAHLYLADLVEAKKASQTSEEHALIVTLAPMIQAYAHGRKA